LLLFDVFFKVFILFIFLFIFKKKLFCIFILFSLVENQSFLHSLLPHFTIIRYPLILFITRLQR